jgi:hypothetical protein
VDSRVENIGLFGRSVSGLGTACDSRTAAGDYHAK